MKHQLVSIEASMTSCFNEINGYIEDNSESKYLTLIPIDEKYGKLLNKSKYLIKSENNYPDDYDKQ